MKKNTCSVFKGLEQRLVWCHYLCDPGPGPWPGQCRKLTLQFIWLVNIKVKTIVCGCYVIISTIVNRFGLDSLMLEKGYLESVPLNLESISS